MNKLATRSGNVKAIIEDILEEAGRIVIAINGTELPKGMDNDNLLSQTIFHALNVTEARRRSYRSAQAILVAKLSRERLWLAFPPDDDNPEGFGDLKEYLRAAGVRGSALSDLAALGNIIIPYCDLHNLSIDRYLTQEKYPLLVEGVPTMRQAIEAEADVSEIEDVLDAVRVADTRNEIRAKYRNTDGYVSSGTVLHNGRSATMVLHFPDEEDVSRVLGRIGGAVDWNLVASAQNGSGYVRITVDGV